MSYRRAWLLVAGCVALTGCNTWYSHIGETDPALGEAAKYDAAIQVINPAPVYAANSTQPGSNGDVGQKAMERYRTDKVKAVEMMETTSGSSGSGGSGSGSGPH